MTKNRRFVTRSPEETMAVGRQLAATLQPPVLLILRGNLGAGKTTLVKGIAEAFGAAEPEEVTSPTFSLVHEYSGMDASGTPLRLYHLDLYRLEEERHLAVLGIDEMAAHDAIVLVEWGEKFSSMLDRADGEIVLTHEGEEVRTIELRLKETCA